MIRQIRVRCVKLLRVKRASALGGRNRLRLLVWSLSLLAGSSFLFSSQVSVAQEHTWRVMDTVYEAKAGKAYPGINEELTWVREIPVSPGGWNGSADYQKFDGSGLQRYRVISRKDNGKSAGEGVVFRTGDLVFPDDRIWRRSEGYKTGYPAGSLAWERATDNSGIDDYENKNRQYEYAKNLPSALAIADAWDGAKNLISGPSGMHEKGDGYYAESVMFWYRDIGNGGGRSRLPRVAEYEKAGGDQLALEDNLLYGTNNYGKYQWSGEQDTAAPGHYSIRTYSAGGSVEGKELVSYPSGGFWVVEK